MYIHHHGSGHITRFTLLNELLNTLFNIVVLSTSDKIINQVKRMGFDGIKLPSKTYNQVNKIDRQFDSAFEGVPHRLCSAERMVVLSQLFVRYPNSVFISDVSAELTIGARLCGFTVVMLRHNGSIANDPTQLFAYECCECLVAPYPQSIEDSDFTFQYKTHYLGFFSRFSIQNNSTKVSDEKNKVISVLTNGYDIRPSTIKALAQTVPLTIQVVGNRTTDDEYPENVIPLGRVDDIAHVLANSNIVITEAGNNTVAEMLTLKKRLVLLPGDRPYNEQHAKAYNLAAKGYAVCVEEPESVVWPEIIDQALKLDIDVYSSLINTMAPTDFANIIKPIADRATTAHG